MAEKSSLSGMTIALLVVGLIVGGAGAYFVVSGPIKTEISGLETQYAQLNTELDSLNAQLVTIQDEYDTLETEKEGLEDEIQNISLDLAHTEAEITTTEHSIEVNTEKIDVFSLMAEPDKGYNVISLFALSFQYPVGMTFEFEQFQENPISEDYGSITGTISKESRDDYIRYVWQKVDFEANAESDLADLVDTYLEQWAESETVSCAAGDVTILERLDHTVYYQSITCTGGSTTWIIYYSTWYCNLDSLYYRLVYVSETPANDDFTHYLDTTLCHR